MDDVAVDDILRFESELIAAVRASHNDLLETIVETKNLPDTDAMDAAVAGFKATFASSAE
jgi:F-type H+-transporting ATPase subunit alpha